MIEYELTRLLEQARHDPQLRKMLWDTRTDSDPMDAFCVLCNRLGYDISLGELFAYGQDMNDSKLRSVNGGGVDGIEGWDDAYEQFFLSLE